MLRTTTATVAATAELAIPALVNTIKAHLAKAAQAADKAEQHYITAGLRLKELKLRKPSATPWPEYVRETFGLGQQRADELIRIADGRTTVEAVHASQKTRDAKRRPSKSNVGHIESPRLKTGEFRRLDGRVQVDDSDQVSPEVKAAADDAKLTSKQRLVIASLPDEAEQLKGIAKMAAINIVADRTEKTAAAKSAKPISDVTHPAEPKLSEFKRTDGTIKPACDFNGEDPGDVEEPGDTKEMIRHRIFVHRASEALRHARENGFDKASTQEITDEILELAATAAKAWADVYATLQRRAKHIEQEKA